MIEGVPYDKLHIITIKSSKNNTIMSLNDHKGLPLKITSAVRTEVITIIMFIG